MVSGYVSVTRAHPLYYRSAVVSRDRHLWGGSSPPYSPRTLANSLVDEVIEYVIEIEVFISDIVCSAFVGYLQKACDIPLEDCSKESVPVEASEVLAICSVGHFLASVCEMSVCLEIAQSRELFKCDSDENFSDYNSTESTETYSEESEISQSSEDWLAVLDFMCDAEVGYPLSLLLLPPLCSSYFQ